MLSTMIRRLAVAGLATLALATAACGGGDDDGGTGPGPAAPAGFSISNGSDREAWYMYSRACGTEDWGEDELGTANILYPGESASWEESAGCTLTFKTGHLTLGADGSYEVAVEAEFNGGGVTMTDEGSYDVSGSSIDFSPSGDPARMKDGTISGSSLTAQTQFGGIPFEIDLQK